MLSNDILTVTEVADRLRCSKAHVCNVINGRVKGVAPLAAIRLGRRMLVRVAALEAWLLQSERGVL
jgi:excisionase family DNA binding protein